MKTIDLLKNVANDHFWVDKPCDSKPKFECRWQKLTEIDGSGGPTRHHHADLSQNFSGSYTGSELLVKLLKNNNMLLQFFSPIPPTSLAINASTWLYTSLQRLCQIHGYTAGFPAVFPCHPWIGPHGVLPKFRQWSPQALRVATLRW